MKGLNLEKEVNLGLMRKVRQMSWIHDIVTCWLVTRQIICRFWILCSVYWIYYQAEFTITYYSLDLTVITLRQFFTDWPLIFLCAPNPNSLSCLRASCRVSNSLHSLHS
jgi:hypothetical protein